MFLSIPDSVMNSYIYLRDVLLEVKLYSEVSLRSNRSSTLVDIDDDSGKRSFIINRRIKTTIRKDILW